MPQPSEPEDAEFEDDIVTLEAKASPANDRLARLLRWVAPAGALVLVGLGVFLVLNGYIV